MLLNGNIERLRRLELYGIEQTHPSEDPRRQQASVVVFHLADVETCDATWVGSRHRFLLGLLIRLNNRAARTFYELLEIYQVRNIPVYSCIRIPTSTKNLIPWFRLYLHQSRGVRLYVTHLGRGLRQSFAKAGIIKFLGEEAFCDNVAEAMARLESTRYEGTWCVMISHQGLLQVCFL